MKGWLWALGGVGVLALGLFLALRVLDQAFSLRPMEEAPCTPGPVPTRAELWTSGVVELPFCRPVRLRLHLEGTPAQGWGAWAVVAEGGRVLWEGEVLGVRTVEVRLTGRALAVLAFTNDLYAPPEDRNLFLRGLEALP